MKLDGGGGINRETEGLSMELFVLTGGLEEDEGLLGKRRRGSRGGLKETQRGLGERERESIARLGERGLGERERDWRGGLLA